MVDWTQTDKQLHYSTGYKYGSEYGLLGFLGILLLGAPGKEAWDFIRNAWYLITWPIKRPEFKWPHSVEWNDIVAGVTGAFDGYKGNTKRY